MPDSLETAQKELFGDSGADDTSGLVDQRRFATEEYYPVYRQWLLVPGYLREADFSEFLHQAVLSPEQAQETFRSWLSTERPQGGVVAEAALDRLDVRANSLSLEEKTAICQFLCNEMDDIVRSLPKVAMFVDVALQGERIATRCLRGIPAERRLAVLGESTVNGRAISWIGANLLRTEVWRHGRVDKSRAREPEEWVLDEDSLGKVERLFARRVESLSSEEIVLLPNAIGFLFGMRDLGAAQRLERLIGDFMSESSTDSEFLDFVAAFQQTVVSSDRGSYTVIHPSAVSALLEFGPFQSRLKDIAFSEPVRPSAERAKNLWAELSLGRD